MKRLVVYSLSAAIAGFVTGLFSYTPQETKELAGIAPNPLANSTPAPPMSPAADGKDLDSEILGLLFQSRSFRDIAELGAVLTRLSSAQIGGLLDRLNRPGVQNRSAMMRRLMTYWAQRDPEAATEWMRPHLASFAKEPQRFGWDLSRISEDEDVGVVRAWAQNVPEQALEFARQHSASGLAGVILAGVTEGPAAGSDADVWRLLSEFPDEKQRTRAMGVFFNRFRERAKADFATAESAALALPPGAARNRAMEEVLIHWKGDDPAAALDRFRSLGVDFPSLVPLVAHRVAQQNPARVAKWLENMDEAEMTRCGKILVAGWAKKDPAEAFAWALEHGLAITETASVELESDSSEPWWRSYEVGGKTPLQAAMSANPKGTAEWLNSLRPGPERARLIEIALLDASDKPDIRKLINELQEDAVGRTVVKMGVFRRPEGQIQEWVSSWPDGPARTAAWQAVGRTAQSETLSLPAGTERDAMFSGVVARYARNPEQAFDYLQRIDDPNRRRQAFDDAMCALRPSLDFRAVMERNERRVYHQWLENAEIPEEWKVPWRMYDAQ